MTNNKSISTSTPATLPHITNRSKEIQLYVNQYVFDDVLHAINHEKLLKFVVHYENLYNKQKNSSYLNTTTFIEYGRLVFGEMEKRYGKNKKMDIKCVSAADPQLKFKVNDTFGKLSFDCDFIVRNSSTLNETAFAALIGIDADVDIKLKNSKIYPKLKTASVSDLSIHDSKIGSIPVFILKPLINSLLFSKGGISSINNVFLKNGFTIPTVYGLSFNQTEFFSQNNYAEFGMNTVFTNKTTYALDAFLKNYKGARKHKIIDKLLDIKTLEFLK